MIIVAEKLQERLDNVWYRIQTAKLKSKSLSQVELDTACVELLEELANTLDPPAPKYKEFKVVSVSQNTNSFGLYGMILVARDGEAWQVAANYLNKKEKGKVFIAREDFYGMGFEIPERLPSPPAEALAKIFA